MMKEIMLLKLMLHNSTPHKQMVMRNLIYLMCCKQNNNQIRQITHQNLHLVMQNNYYHLLVQNLTLFARAQYVVDYIGSLFPWRLSPPPLSPVLQILHLYQIYQDLYSDEIIFVSIQVIFSPYMAC